MHLKLVSACALTFIIIFTTSLNVNAQPILNDNDELLNEARFMLGISSMDFTFRDRDLMTIAGENDFTYQFNGDVYTAYIGSGKFTGLSVSFGTNTESFFSSALADSLLEFGPENAIANEADVRFLNVRASLGGNSQLWQNIMRQDLNLYLPIRVHLNYFNVYYDTANELKDIFNAAFQQDFRPLNKLEASFNIGLGVNYRTDRFFPLLQDRLLFDLHFTRGLGANIQYTDGDMFYGGARHDEVNASVHFLRILGQTSLVTGFRHIQTRSNQDGFDDFFAMLNDPDIFESSHSSLMFFVGIKF
ncbi:hypothetical protein CYPRO_2559 [Cyclonatronum proteinivorum]|uniref:Outer membrane protein beta-barrel domain-containing protein n=1 Tax=Cyclonatronum proteinivorum TaxID=1457365 RepID=A0A345UMU9_9BACT|nr:hypothetical protein [Cyclonatronum proteinivorum]AXJ01801.1 hypothetical protein CYPRO_2559 [Cyclonatronum proteinivorum]